MNYKDISIKLDKDVWEEFKRILEEIYGLSHIIYLEYFIYYSNFPNIAKIIEFRGGFPYKDILPKDTTEAYKISLKEPNKIKHSLENISTYLREVITVFVENPKLFMEIFNITDFYIQWDIEETSFKLKSPISFHHSSFVQFDELLLKDLKSIDEIRTKCEDTLVEKLHYRQYSDFKYEQTIYNHYHKYGKFENLSEDLKEQIFWNKLDYKNTNNYLEIVSLYSKICEIMLVYVYKTIITKQKRISTFYNTFKIEIINEYKKAIKESNIEITLEEFIKQIIVNEYQLIKFAIHRKAEINLESLKKIRKNINSLK
ncbi:hypothetical protein ACOL24_05035 [Aliarcobacter butzleri]|uniref:hypothetical protein n=1 Tax=Aliarcobacter butzleri TaxID=28197 RepID=UPI003AFADDEF